MNVGPRLQMTGIILVICIFMLGCTLSISRTLLDATPKANSDGWQTIGRGIERREMDFSVGKTHAHAILIRVDPSQVTFRVHYSPGVPYSLDEWRSQLPGAELIVNGGFFDHYDMALGLLVSDGVAYGETFSGFGGMFEVGANGTRVRSLVGEPYAGEPLIQAAQGFPMLIEAGGVMASRGDGFDTRSRRTWIGQDAEGHILFGLIPYGLISLAELQDWLWASDLNLSIAVGLDGGRSTGMIIQTPGTSEVYPAIDQLPSVIAIYPIS